jgi:hypothetical protein
VTKDSNGSLIAPRWAIWAVLGLGGAGSGASGVTAYKVSALAERLSSHEALPGHASVTQGLPWQTFVSTIEELKREVAALREAKERTAERLATIESILIELRGRPR